MDDIKGEKRLLQSIVIQAIKDYVYLPEERTKIKKWVTEEQGLFNLCALAMSQRSEDLKEMMIDKMKDIERGGGLK